jgi:2,4-dienoyl-CoA reductase-like NADH-dependent reductase (Old Yellow Enzyme family)
MGKKDALFTPIKIGTKTAVNRIALNAMECNDADKNGDPSELTYTRYRKNFEGNAGVIVVEAISVISESRGRLNQLIGTPSNLKGLTKLFTEMKKVNDKPLLIIQLTHSGELSEPKFSRRVCVKPLPGFGGDLLTEEEVEDIIDNFVSAAKVAHDAGADGVDVKRDQRSGLHRGIEDIRLGGISRGMWFCRPRYPNPRPLRALYACQGY